MKHSTQDHEMTQNPSSPPSISLEKTLRLSTHVIQEIITKLDAGNGAEAADLYAHCQQDVGLALIERVKSDRRLFKAAANMFYRARDFEKAALCCQSLGDLEKAALLFEYNDDHHKAAQLYLHCKNHAKAAEMLEQCQKPGKAAEQYLLVKNFSKAALNYEKDQSFQLSADLYHKLGNFHKTLDLLQNIPPSDPGHAEARHKIKELIKNRNSDDFRFDQTAQPNVKIVSFLEGFDFLRNVSLFRDLALQDMKSLYHICSRRVFQDAERVIEQGEPGLALYVIHTGKALVQRIEDTKPTNIAVLHRGDHFGEMSLIDESPTSARVIAEDQLDVFEISRDRFLRFLDSNPRLAVRVLTVFVRTLCKRLRETNIKLTE